MLLKVLCVREEVMDVFGISLNVSIMYTSLLKKLMVQRLLWSVQNSLTNFFPLSIVLVICVVMVNIFMNRCKNGALIKL